MKTIAIQNYFDFTDQREPTVLLAEKITGWGPVLLIPGPEKNCPLFTEIFLSDWRRLIIRESPTHFAFRLRYALDFDPHAKHDVVIEDGNSNCLICGSNNEGGDLHGIKFSRVIFREETGEVVVVEWRNRYGF